MLRQKGNGLHPENKERNERIASILTLLLTLSSKIEKIKQKLCGFDHHVFSPQNIFEALDLTSKGNLDLYDLKEFIHNQRIRDEDIARMIIRFGSASHQPKMTYLCYLNLLKPHFNHQLARDLLNRDTLTDKAQPQIHRDMQQAVLLLVNQLFLLNCVLTAEHEDLKIVLMDEYMLNCLELRQILGLGGGSPLRAIFEFIDCNSCYQVQEAQVKYLLAYLRVPQYELGQQHVLSWLFLPTRIKHQLYSTTQRAGMTDYVDRQRQKMHQNYDKKYLGRNDLSVASLKLSFLNYIHPNSYEQQPVRDVEPTKRPPTKRQRNFTSEDLIASQHTRLDLQNELRIKKSFKKTKQVFNEEQRARQSQVQASGDYHSKVPVRLIPASQVAIQTPVLQQFMHQSNIKRNMGDYHGNPQNHQLNVLLQQSAVSHMSNSEAFQRIPMNNQSNCYQPQRQQSRFRKQELASRDGSLLKQDWRPKGMEVVSGRMKASSGLGILDQFMRADLA